MLGEWRSRWDRKEFERLMSLPSLAAGVGHPEESFPLVVRTEGVSSQNRRRAGVAFSLKRQGEFVPPPPRNRVRNLLSKDLDRFSLADEGYENWRKMAPIALALRSTMSD
jgi:hypothetical protein